MTRKTALIAACAAVVAWLAFTAIYTIDETEQAIVTRFGRALPGVAGPGLHVKAPWPIDSVVRMDSRLLVFDAEPTELLTLDKKNVLIDSFICWKIADPLRFTQTVKARPEAEARLLDIMSSALGAAVGSEPIEHFLNVDPTRVKLREISKRVAEAVNGIATSSFGIEIVDLQINGFNLPAQNRASVIKRMRAERARIATKYRSEGEEEALKIEAQAVAEREKILAEASAQAEAIRGEGEAEALRLFADAYAKDPDFYRFLRTLETYEKIVGEKTTIFLSADSPLLRQLHGE